LEIRAEGLPLTTPDPAVLRQLAYGYRVSPDGIVVACRLTPKGGRDAIEGVARLSDGTSVLIARMRAAPEDGRANEALRALLAAKLGARSLEFESRQTQRAG
jgi:uncharacterized protein YggU (UPF0235/DUF167 family)